MLPDADDFPALAAELAGDAAVAGHVGLAFAVPKSAVSFRPGVALGGNGGGCFRRQVVECQMSRCDPNCRSFGGRGQSLEVTRGEGKFKTHLAAFALDFGSGRACLTAGLEDTLHAAAPRFDLTRAEKRPRQQRVRRLRRMKPEEFLHGPTLGQPFTAYYINPAAT